MPRAGWQVLLAAAVLALTAPAATAKPAASAKPDANPASLPAQASAPALEPRFARIADVPRGVVASLAQDRTGFIWFGGGNGLTRFDGQRLRIVDREADSLARRNLGWVRALLASEDGRLWIGTEADGIAVHDPATGRTHDVPYDLPGDTSASPGVKALPPTVLALASNGAGGLWAGTAGGGLQHYAARAPLLQRDATAFAGPDMPGGAGDRVHALLRAQDGTLWLGSERGLARLPRGASQLEVLALPPRPAEAGAPAADPVQALRQMADGRIWIGTLSGRLAVAAADGGTVQWLDGGSTPGPAAQVTALVQDRDGIVWVGRATGIDLRAPEDGRLLRRLVHDARRPLGLAGNEVTALLLDRAGSVWVGGLGLGLQRHDPGNRAMQWREADIGADGAGGAFADADVRALLQHPDGSVWAAARGGGVVRFDAGLRQAEPLPQPRFPAAPVNAMAVRRDGRVWLADSASLQLRAANGTLLREVAHAAGEVWQMMEHADGSVWLTSKVGLFRLAPGAPEPQPLRGPEGQVLRQQMFMLAARPDGAVWASSVGGLFLAAADGSSVRPVGFVEGAGLANPIVIGLLIDRSGRLWLDTAVTGLHREVGRVGDLLKLDQVSLRHGVAGHPFGANLLEDARGRIWTHMSMYDPGGDRLVALTAADGAALGTGWFGAYAATPDGRLLFGSSRGILAVDARAFEPHGAPPPLAVAGLRINGVPQMAGQLQPGLVLGSRDRFTIDLAGLDYVAGQRTRYRFKLEGFDAQWSAANSDVRSASYGNLDPGRYRLQAQVASGEGPWSSPPLEVTVDVMPVWWQTAAARLLVLLLLATAVYGLLQWRTRQLRVRQAELELRVHERTGALQALTAELEREKAALVESTFTDPLTGLRNRRFLAQHIEADTALSRRRHVEALQEGTPPPDADIVFFVIDIDHFKSVNDVHGHTAGDAVIQQMADRLRAVFRDSDHLVRWGGEEFLVVARGTARRHARELAERLCNTVADAPFQLEGGATLHKTCTVGFAAFPLSPQQPGALSWTETVHLADTALLAAKAAGRNSWLGLRDGGTLAVAELQAAVHQGAAGWRTTGGLAIESRGGGASDESAGAGRVS